MSSKMAIFYLLSLLALVINVSASSSTKAAPPTATATPTSGPKPTATAAQTSVKATATAKATAKATATAKASVVPSGTIAPTRTIAPSATTVAKTAAPASASASIKPSPSASSAATASATCVPVGPKETCVVAICCVKSSAGWTGVKANSTIPLPVTECNNGNGTVVTKNISCGKICTEKQCTKANGAVTLVLHMTTLLMALAAYWILARE